MSRKKKEAENVLSMIPVRVYEWDENKIVTVKVPRFRSKVGQRFCRLIKKDATYNVNQDKYSSAAWKLCDGERTVGAIGKALREQFEEDVDPINERIAVLFDIMEANGLIRYNKHEKYSGE